MLDGEQRFLASFTKLMSAWAPRAFAPLNRWRRVKRRMRLRLGRRETVSVSKSEVCDPESHHWCAGLGCGSRIFVFCTRCRYKPAAEGLGDLLLTVAEVAWSLGIEAQRVRNYMASGRLKFVGDAARQIPVWALAEYLFGEQEPDA